MVSVALTGDMGEATAAGMPEPSPAPIVTLMGVRIAAITERHAIDRILHALDAGRGGRVVTLNLDIMRRCVVDPAFGELVARAELVVPDGMPLVWASRLQRTPLPERVAGSTMVDSLAGAAAAAGRSLFLLGGAPGAAEGAGNALRARYPNLIIAGTYCPPLGFERDPEECARMEAALRDARPDLVYVALGSPKQEHLIERLRPLFPATWWLGVGISLGFLSGQVKRAPGWAQRLGLEWVHRMVQEPRRLARRYLVNGIPFAIRLLFTAAVGRGAGTKPRGIGTHRGDSG